MVELLNGRLSVVDVQRKHKDIFVVGISDIMAKRPRSIVSGCDNVSGVRTKDVTDNDKAFSDILEDFIAIAKLNLDRTVWFPGNGLKVPVTAPRCAALVEELSGILLNEEPAVALSMIKKVRI